MSSIVDKPTNLYFFKPSRNFYALSWQVNPGVNLNEDLIHDLTQFDCEVQIDSVNSFDSINLKIYSKYNVYSYQDGYFFKAFIFEDKNILQDVTYFFRVRVNSSFYISDWSDYLSFNLSKITWYDDSNNLFSMVPDKNVYTKEGLSFSYKIIEAYSREIQELKKETNRISDNINFYKVQDSNLYEVLGILLEYERNLYRPYIEYRKELLNLWNSFLFQGTEAGIKLFLKTIFGWEPTIKYIRDRYGWVVFNEQSLIFPYYPYDPEEIFENNTLHHFLYDPSYTDLKPTIQPNSIGSKGFTWILNIYNPFMLPTRQKLIESFVNRIKPVNTKVYISYYYLDSISTIGWGGSRYWGNDNYWGEKEIVWKQYIPSD